MSMIMADNSERPANQFSVSLVILTWNSGEYIKRCIESYAVSFFNQGITAEFIIVDNGSTDTTANIVEQDIKPFLPVCCDLQSVQLEKNHGTTISRNIGIAKAKGEIIVICDSDTEFMQGEWEKAFSIIKNNQKIGIVAPSLFYENGDIQHSVKKFPTLTDKLRKIPKIFLNFPMEDKDFYADFPWQKSTVVDSAISACWILSKKTVEEVGPLDENIFYSPEDLDYCLRIWEAGKQVIYYPDIKLTHHTQQISYRKPFSRQAISHFKGLLYYFSKHHYWLSRRRLYKRFEGWNSGCAQKK